MSTLRFIELIQEDMGGYVCILIICLIGYMLIFSRKVRSIFDPLAFSIVFTNSICTANVIFLQYMGNIRPDYFLNYIATETIFIFGFLSFSTGRGIKLVGQACLRYKYDSPMVVNGFLYTGFAMLASSTLYMYTISGIPLLLTSRYDATMGGAGLGIFTRLSSSANVIFVIAFFMKRRDNRERTNGLDLALFLASICFGFLSGYKAFFLIYLNVYYLINKEDLDRKRSLPFWRLIGLGLIGIFVLILLFMIILKTTNIGMAGINLVYRIIASGDVYYMSYGNDIIGDFPKTGFFFQLFGSSLASLRIIGWDEAPKNLGLYLNEVVSKYKVNAGPTFRYNVLWLYLTGHFFSIFLSFLTGAIIGFLEKSTRSFRRERSVGYIFIIFIYIKSFQFILGPDQAINESVFSLIFFGFFFMIVEMACNLANAWRRRRASYEIRDSDGNL